MKSKNKKITIIIIAVIAVAAVFCIYFFNTPYMKVRLFTGDRITGSFNLSVNDTNYTPDTAFVDYEQNGKNALNLKDSKFSFKGGKYGPYTIVFNLNNTTLAKKSKDNTFKGYPKTTTLTINYFNANNWNIEDFDIDASFEKVDGKSILNVNIVRKYLTEDYKTYETILISESFVYDDIATSGGEISFGL